MLRSKQKQVVKRHTIIYTANKRMASSYHGARHKGVTCPEICHVGCYISKVLIHTVFIVHQMGYAQVLQRIA